MRKLIPYLKNYKKESIIGPLFKLLEAVFELIVPLVTARIIDIGIQNRDIPYIWKMAALLVAFGVMGLLCSLLAQYFAAKAAVGFGTELRHDLFCHIEQLSYAAVDKAGSATLVVRITSDGIYDQCKDRIDLCRDSSASGACDLRYYDRDDPSV